MKNSLGDAGENGVEKQLSVLRGRFSPRVFLEDASRVLCRFFSPVTRRSTGFPLEILDP